MVCSRGDFWNLCGGLACHVDRICSRTFCGMNLNLSSSAILENRHHPSNYHTRARLDDAVARLAWPLCVLSEVTRSCIVTAASTQGPGRTVAQALTGAAAEQLEIAEKAQSELLAIRHHGGVAESVPLQASQRRHPPSRGAARGAPPRHARGSACSRRQWL